MLKCIHVRRNKIERDFHKMMPFMSVNKQNESLLFMDTKAQGSANYGLWGKCVLGTIFEKSKDENEFLKYYQNRKNEKACVPNVYLTLKS